MTQKQRDFLDDLKALFIKYDATIRTFEDEFIIDIKSEDDIWIEDHPLSVDAIDNLK